MSCSISWMCQLVDVLSLILCSDSDLICQAMEIRHRRIESEISRVSLNHTYTVFLTRKSSNMYGHIRCIYTVLANTIDMAGRLGAKMASSKDNQIQP